MVFDISISAPASYNLATAFYTANWYYLLF